MSGSARGTRLKVPAGKRVRPTPDRVREALFSILGSAVVDAAVVDLFAGSGALGLEAISRGARSVCFVERDKRVASVLYSNIDSVRARELASVVVGDVLRQLARLGRQGARFDLVFVDPPYGEGMVPRTLKLLNSSGVLEAGAWVVVDHPADETMPQSVGYGMTLVDRRVYGGVALAIYRVAGEEE